MEFLLFISLLIWLKWNSVLSLGLVEVLRKRSEQCLKAWVLLSFIIKTRLHNFLWCVTNCHKLGDVNQYPFVPPQLCKLRVVAWLSGFSAQGLTGRNPGVHLACDLAWGQACLPVSFRCWQNSAPSVQLYVVGLRSLSVPRSWFLATRSLLWQHGYLLLLGQQENPPHCSSKTESYVM